MGSPPAWDERLAALGRPASLLQSWAWGEVQARSGWSIARVELARGAASVQLGGRGPLRWGYVPRGPLPGNSLPDLIAWARSQRLARLRVEPDEPEAFVPELRRLGFRRAPETQPGHTVFVGLGSEEEMLASFKPKTRYNIRLAQKKGVTVEEGEDAAELVAQARETARRQRITLPPESYYRLLMDLLPFCRTYVARYEGQALAAILVAHHDGRAYYLYGGASGRRRELMPAYAAQWAAMRAAAERGCRDYDLWGVPPAPDPGHPWHGLWQFKTGFADAIFAYAGSWELSLNRWARVVGAQEALTRTVRTVRARA